MREAEYKESNGYKDTKGEGVFTRVEDNENAIDRERPRCTKCNWWLDKGELQCPICKNVIV